MRNMKKFALHVRGHFVAYLALFFALGGTSIAAVNSLPRDSVASPQIKNGSIQKVDISKSTVSALRGPRGLTGGTGAPGAMGAAGAQGTQGPKGDMGPAGPGASAQGTVQSIPNDDETRIVFNSVDYDHGGLLNLAADQGRFTVPVAGTYLLVGSAGWASNGAGRRSLGFVINNNAYAGYQTDVPFGTATTWQNFSRIVHLNAGDFVEIRGYQTSGGALNIEDHEGISPIMSVQWIGA
jgi:hypothetical protein